MTRLSILVLAALAAILPAAAQPVLPDSLDLSKIRSIVVQDQGRCMPLDTQARDIVSKVTGQEYHGGHDPVLLLLAWTFDPEAWMRMPLIPVRNVKVRNEMRLPADNEVFSYEELTRHEYLNELMDRLKFMVPGRKPDPLESKVGSIHEKLLLLREVYIGAALRPIPDPENALGAWRSTSLLAMSRTEKMQDARKAWMALKSTFLSGDAEAFADASDSLAGALETLPAAHRPDPKTLETELRYNRIRPFRTAWMIMVLGTLFSALALLVRRKWFDWFSAAVILSGFAVLTWGLSMRWTIANRIPAANMFESLLFLSWGMGAFAIVALPVFRHRIVPLTASFMGALSLCLADSLPLDQFVRPIAPVLLDTVWMSIHVPIIMVSYAALAKGVLIAHVQIWMGALVPGRRQLIDSVDRLHYWFINAGAIVLFIGIITGSMWASSSWGRYWGWDPKEVWSLVAFLGYMAILHVRISKERVPGWAYVLAGFLAVALFAVVVPKLAPVTALKILSLSFVAAAMVFFVVASSRMAVAAKSILAFWLIIMTYVGVNYVLGIGLHSYGFGTGAVAIRIFTIGAIDLLSVVILFVVYLIRSRPRSPESPAVAAA